MIRNTILAAVAAFAVAGPAFAEDALRVGVEGAYPPFSSKEADGTLVGFDIEMANALCAVLERECVLVEQDWDGMIPALKARKFDAIVASMSITEERKTQIDFSQKYYQSPARILAAKDGDVEATAEGLAGKRLGVQRGTTHQCFAEKFFPDAELVLYATEEEVFRDLVIGRLDAQLSNGLNAAEKYLPTEEGAKFDFVGGDQTDLECYGEGVGVAVRQGEEELRDAISAAILALRENGTYAQINDKFFPVDIYGGSSE